MEKRQNELRDLLREGVAALREIRKGMGNACADLRDLYRKIPEANNENTAGKKYAEQSQGWDNRVKRDNTSSVATE